MTDRESQLDGEPTTSCFAENETGWPPPPGDQGEPEGFTIARGSTRTSLPSAEGLICLSAPPGECRPSSRTARRSRRAGGRLVQGPLWPGQLLYRDPAPRQDSRTRDGERRARRPPASSARLVATNDVTMCGGRTPPPRAPGHRTNTTLSDPTRCAWAATTITSPPDEMAALFPIEALENLPHRRALQRGPLLRAITAQVPAPEADPGGTWEKVRRAPPALPGDAAPRAARL